MWAKIDDGLPEHRKLFAAASEIKRAGYARALAMVIQGICYSNRTLSDGFVPRNVVNSFHDSNPIETSSALVSANIWHAAKNGFQIHDYDHYQPNAEEVKRKRELDRERKQTTSLRNPDGIHEESERNIEIIEVNSERNPERSRARVPSRPVPSRPFPSEDIKEKQELAKSQHASADADFVRFCQAYPASRRITGKKGRTAFRDATHGRNGTHLTKLFTALEQQKHSEQWQTPKLIPLMTTWLNQERWNQELPCSNPFGTGKAAHNTEVAQRFIDRHKR